MQLLSFILAIYTQKHWVNNKKYKTQRSENVLCVHKIYITKPKTTGQSIKYLLFFFLVIHSLRCLSKDCWIVLYDIVYWCDPKIPGLYERRPHRNRFRSQTWNAASVRTEDASSAFCTCTDEGTVCNVQSCSQVKRLKTGLVQRCLRVHYSSTSKLRLFNYDAS